MRMRLRIGKKCYLAHFYTLHCPLSLWLAASDALRKPSPTARPVFFGCLVFDAMDRDPLRHAKFYGAGASSNLWRASPEQRRRQIRFARMALNIEPMMVVVRRSSLKPGNFNGRPKRAQTGVVPGSRQMSGLERGLNRAIHNGRTIYDLRQFRLGCYELPTVNLQEIRPCV